MSELESVSQWIVELKRGDEDAAALLWQRYFTRMVEAARQRLGLHKLAVADEEDVALSAFDNLCRGAVRGHFTQLNDRNDLWPLLLTIVAQKSVDRIRWEHRQRRGGKCTVLREADLPDKDRAMNINEILGRAPTPEFLMLMDEQCSRLLSGLRDDTLRRIVNWKLEGHTNQAIATFLGISVHSVGRKLRMIRVAWSQELDATQ